METTGRFGNLHGDNQQIWKLKLIDQEKPMEVTINDSASTSQMFKVKSRNGSPPLLFVFSRIDLLLSDHHKEVGLPLE
ncbi:hypothetical protein DICVIV_11958 [Dictyocaulus viviparus]|uniref:Uncharacterized protein n=1 Tax=Dictyocaulus viviparus TaxID=29172 RepID=A0A0D8XEG7_DICVI|nr:hypothetical protein DICVIV_11958 [Dictyocaulus viviparus]